MNMGAEIGATTSTFGYDDSEPLPEINRRAEIAAMADNIAAHSLAIRSLCKPSAYLTVIEI
jgi:aconitase A